MGLIEKIARQDGIHIVTRGALRLVASEDAPRVLDACEAIGLRVLGFEGFELVGETVQPDMSAIADLSLVGPDESIREARRIVNCVARDGLHLHFTLGKPPRL